MCGRQLAQCVTICSWQCPELGSASRVHTNVRYCDDAVLSCQLEQCSRSCCLCSCRGKLTVIFRALEVTGGLESRPWGLHDARIDSCKLTWRSKVQSFGGLVARASARVAEGIGSWDYSTTIRCCIRIAIETHSHPRHTSKSLMVYTIIHLCLRDGDPVNPKPSCLIKPISKHSPDLSNRNSYAAAVCLSR